MTLSVVQNRAILEQAKKQCHPQIAALHDVKAKMKDRHAALDQINEKVHEITRAALAIREESTQKIDEGKSIVGLTAKLSGITAEVLEYQKRADSIAAEIKTLLAAEENAKKNLYTALRTAFFNLLPETEEKVTEIVDQAIQVLSIWEANVRATFAEYDLAFNDDKRLITGFWAIEESIGQLNAYCRTDLDGFGYQEFKRAGGRI
jgi:DNA repair exonuclease SbcCD ATPase subunit